MIKPFLILQLRPEDVVVDNELAAILKYGNLNASDTHWVRMEKEGVPIINLDDYSGVIIGGGPYGVSDVNKGPEQKRFESQLYLLLEKIIDNDFPFLGECFGLGILASYLGGTVSKERYGENMGPVTISLNKEALSDPLLADLPQSFRAFTGHKEACQQLPPGSVLLASSKDCPVQIIRIKKNIYATQFHPALDSHGLALRIKVYKHADYFPPEDVDKLIALAKKETVTVPEIILRRFVKLYSQPKPNK